MTLVISRMLILKVRLIMFVIVDVDVDVGDLTLRLVTLSRKERS